MSVFKNLCIPNGAKLSVGQRSPGMYGIPQIYYSRWGFPGPGISKMNFWFQANELYHQH